jgi:hypothetical protein
MESCTPVSDGKPSPAAVPDSSNDRMYRVKLVVLVLCVFVCALSLRLFFVQEVILQNAFLYDDLNAARNAGFLTADSDAYMNLAKKISSVLISVNIL